MLSRCLCFGHWVVSIFQQRMPAVPDFWDCKPNSLGLHATRVYTVRVCGFAICHKRRKCYFTVGHWLPRCSSHSHNGICTHSGRNPKTGASTGPAKWAAQLSGSPRSLSRVVFPPSGGLCCPRPLKRRNSTAGVAHTDSWSKVLWHWGFHGKR